MKYLCANVLLITLNCCIAVGQTKSELEEQRNKTLEEISYVDNLLRSTTKEKNENIGAIRILSNKVNLRESVINGMSSEIDLFNERIEINRLAIEMMEEDLKVLKDDYSKSIINSYKSKKLYPDIVYVLSAKDFNQGYKRLKYLQQVTKYRRSEFEIIGELKEEIKNTRSRLEGDLMKVSDLQQKEIVQKNILKSEQERKQTMLKSLGKKEKQLKKELEEKKKVAKKLENEIAKIIEEERKRNLKSDLTPEQKLIGENFSDNKGRLPWPVERGTITSHFGTHQHPVLKYLTEENVGIEITSAGKTMARCVFKGEVTALFAISGTNMTVIIQHGKYFSVYSNLINVKVKKGDRIEAKQEIGQVFTDPGANNNCTVKLMIFEERKALDPELWIAKI